MRRGCICLLAVLANRRCENSKQEYSFLHRNKMKQSGEEGGRHVGFINQVVGGVSIGPAWGYNEETLKGRTIRAADVEGIHRMLYKLLYDRRQCRSCNHDILLVSRYQISQQRFPCPWIHTEFSHTKQENRLQMTAHSLISPQLRLKKKCLWALVVFLHRNTSFTLHSGAFGWIRSVGAQAVTRVNNTALFIPGQIPYISLSSAERDLIK